MPKKNGQPTKKELKKAEEETRREQWEEPEEIRVFEPQTFNFCKVRPKNVSGVLTPLGVFMLFFGSVLPTVAKGVAIILYILVFLKTSHILVFLKTSHRLR